MHADADKQLKEIEIREIAMRVLFRRCRILTRAQQDAEVAEVLSYEF